MKFRDCTSMNSTENIQEGYRNGLSKMAAEFKNCKQQLFTLTMCLPACLWAQIAKTPFNYTITAQTLLVKYDDYRFQLLILQFPALGKKYRIASVFIMTRAVSTPRDVERRESGSMFCESIEPFPEVRMNRVESMKTQRWKVQWLNNEIYSFRGKTISILSVSLFAPRICGP